MKGNKAPGPDGMPALFYQHYWDTVGSDVGNMVLNCVNEGIFLKNLNFTLIMLIPKMASPVNMSQFHPIALCNTSAKLISKVLTERLKHILPSIILESQSAFVLRGASRTIF
ncbi:hypothetical protein LIER_42236 [Lithospermum erythrorhizon]|uniref:Reverse transcriptase domain-containing protein n=1 Tax=Lithospermum erythrorhizon TaxID=34254 RepID=A0AAV3RMD4_LITER